MDVLTLLDKLDQSTVAPVYLLHGPERFLIDEVVSRLRELLLAGPMADLNFSRLKAGETSGAEIVAEARAVPMLESQRLVVVDSCEKLKARDQEVLDPYLKEPAVESCLVLVGTKYDLRRGMFNRANRRGQAHKAEPLKEPQIIPFVKLRARARSVHLTPRAEAAIAAAVGADCAALDDAVERVGLFAGPDEEVDEAHVGEVVTAVRQRSVFELVDAIGNRNQPRALSLLEELLGRREEPLRLNALLARHMRQLIGARIQLARGADEGRAAAEIGVPPFVARKLLGQSRRFRGWELETALARLARSDLELKSSRRSGELILEQAVMDLCLGD